MMESVQGDQIEHVIVHEISRLARSLQDIECAIQRSNH